MAAMGSKNASVTEDERQQYIVPGFVRESQNAYSNYVPDGVVRTIDKFYVDKIRESTSEIIDNFAKRFSAILKQFDEIQNVLDSPGSSHTSMSRFIPQILQQLMQNIPFANPDTGKTVKLKKSNNKRKKKDTTYSGFKRGFLNAGSKKKKKTKTNYVKSTEKNESVDYSAEAKHDNESAYGGKKEKKVKKTKKKANEHA
eukprot:228438_1